MQSKVRNKIKFLHDKELFVHWTGLGKAGSLKLLVIYSVKEGWLNPKTGRPPTTMACWNAMWRWAIRNMAEARPFYAQYVLDFGDYLTDDEWMEVINDRAKQLLTPAGYRKFLVKHPEVVKYNEKRSRSA